MILTPFPPVISFVQSLTVLIPALLRTANADLPPPPSGQRSPIHVSQDIPCGEYRSGHVWPMEGGPTPHLSVYPLIVENRSHSLTATWTTVVPPLDPLPSTDVAKAIVSVDPILQSANRMANGLEQSGSVSVSRM